MQGIMKYSDPELIRLELEARLAELKLRKRRQELKLAGLGDQPHGGVENSTRTAIGKAEQEILATKRKLASILPRQTDSSVPPAASKGNWRVCRSFHDGKDQRRVGEIILAEDIETFRNAEAMRRKGWFQYFSDDDWECRHKTAQNKTPFELLAVQPAPPRTVDPFTKCVDAIRGEIAKGCTYEIAMDRIEQTVLANAQNRHIIDLDSKPTSGNAALRTVDAFHKRLRGAVLAKAEIAA